jgi:DNA-binding Xre family transcriptional regulator
MLRLTLDPLVRQKGAKSTAIYLRAHGFSVKESRTLSNTPNVAQLRDEMVQRLCEALLVTPNALFRWHGAPQSHLSVLNTQQHVVLNRSLDEMTQQQLDALYGQIGQLPLAKASPTPQHAGTLRLNVKRLVDQRQPHGGVLYLRSKGFTLGEARKLLDPKRMAVKVTMLTRLCTVFGCLPNDLYDWQGTESHPLNTLRKQPVPDLVALLANLPAHEVQRILRGEARS